MDIFSGFQKISEIGTTVRDKQTLINVSEVWHLWDHLSERYSILNTTTIFRNFARDNDLRIVLDMGVKTLTQQVTDLEAVLGDYGIQLPYRPPTDVVSATQYEAIDDKYIFRRVFRGIQSFVETHAEAFLGSTSPIIRQKFKKFSIEEMDLYDKLIEYGKLKGFTLEPPPYRV